MTDITEQLVVEISVADLERSLALYTALGFRLERRDGGFAVLRWDERRLFLSEVRALPALGAHPSRANLRILTPDVDAAWARVQALRDQYALVIEQAIGDRYYGLRDFTVLDLDGFGLRFASPRSDPT